MSADEIDFDVKLKEEISGPAHAAKSALHELGGEAKAAAGAVDTLAHHVEEAGKKHHEAHGFLEEFSKSLIPQIALGELAAEGLKKLGEAVLEGVHFAVEAAEFKENMVDAYGVIQGGVEEGERTFRKIDELAKGLHMPTEKAHELAQSLMLQGLTNQKELTGAIEAVSNLQRVGMAAGAEHVKSAIERSLATGHFEITSKLLKGTGTNIDAVYDLLAQRLHVSSDKIKEEMKDGKISVDDGISAITDAINGSSIAELAHKKFTITDALTDIKNSVRGLFQEADAGPLVDAFRDVAKAIEPGTEGAETFRAVLNDTISVAAGLVDAIASVAKAAKWAADAVSDMTTNVMLLGHTEAEQTAIRGALDTAKQVQAEQLASQKDYQDKADAFDARFEEKKAVRAAHAAGGGDHKSKYDNPLEDKGYRSGGIGAEGMAQWKELLGELGLGPATSATSATSTASRAGAAVAPKVGQVHMGGVTVQIQGVAHAEDILTLLPSALVDVLEQASNEVGA